MKMKQMRCMWVMVLVSAAAFTACQTYQVGATIEPRKIANTIGVVLTTEAEYAESTFIFFPDIHRGAGGWGLGYDLDFKYPFHLARNHISVFPMLGLEGRFIKTPMEERPWGIGINVGAGFDISPAPAFFIRGKVIYQPEFTSFMTSYSGFRYSLGLGYRTEDSSVRSGISRSGIARKKAQEKRNRERNLIRATTSNPHNPQAFYELGLYYYSEGKIVPAANAFERTLELDPAFRHTPANDSFYTSSDAASFGIQTSSNFTFGKNYSLNYYLACGYYDAANKTDTDRDKAAAPEDKQSTLEKVLAALRRGYEIDITGGANNSRNLKAVYLALMGKTLDLLGRTGEAAAAYVELAGTVTVTNDVAYRAASAGRSGQSYYVSASGSDNNDGLSENTPLRSLALAYEKVKTGTVKRITVMGTLNHQNEGAKSTNEYVFNLSDPKGANTAEILIAGQWGAARAVLSGTGSGKNVVRVDGNIRFEYIEISGGELNSEDKNGTGITVEKTVTIGPGTAVRANKGKGLVNGMNATCTLAGGDIHNNEDSGVANLGSFTMRSGSIRNNTAKDGGGVYNAGTFTMSGGSITNNTAKSDGGGFCIGPRLLGEAVFTMTGGTISNNKAVYGGGVYLINIKEELDINGGTFRQSGGSISDNSATVGGGVFVGRNSRYDKTAGTVSSNSATHHITNALPGSDDNNITRAPGSLGSGR